MNSHELIASIIRKDTLECDNNTLLSEVNGWDSLKGVRLVLRLEEAVGRELSESEIESLQSVGDVDRILSLAR